jgi:hypothetical protein
MAKKPKKPSVADIARSEAHISISEAAKRGYTSRPTIHRHMKGGKISATEMPDGSKRIAIAELERVYGSLQGDGRDHDTDRSGVADKVADTSKAGNDVLRERVRGLEQQLERSDQDREWLRERLERAEALLTDQRPTKNEGLIPRIKRMLVGDADPD